MIAGLSMPLTMVATLTLALLQAAPANPPYDHRLPASRTALTALARLRTRIPGWRLAILHPDPSAVARILRASPRTTHRLDNGGLRVTLSIY